ncbi:hypothetical protein PtA15_2A599 [Puccinia triticina]|uniref:Putative 5'-nucleotidase C-terminal domain-containing protein n=1 Tax=Puccinia triticina TaxID=208348 RepID=A0ABY7CCV4_9BASI|nr:uncharacterized protein PtA15_2A599 [Puccinia triticina]WAQ82282.1 hypothetical protein PtA15_2A599 [Puccinia triticina]WAR53136.1 hypothetical protein PtB15_2B567 [Puccinia triticina]
MGKTPLRSVLLWIPVVSLLWKSSQVLACNDHLQKRSQPSASPPPGAPNRELEWGDLNILHTTDSHVRSFGHLKSEQPEPNYSGDFGDFHSFVQRMKKKASQKGVDLLVVDSGDLHDGNGLCDAEPYVHPGTPRGTTLTKIFTRVPYDILAIGNHELYDPAIAQSMHDNFAPSWNGSYLTSNVNITTSGTSVPLGSRYRKFVTEQGRKVTAFGILFHFTGNAKGTVVQPPSELVKEPWFKEAIRDKPDVFLLAGHMGVQDPNWKRVLATIRDMHPEVPVIILGGHFHIRDCRQLDDRSMSLASGRYMETLGWMSLSGLDKPGEKPEFSRRYLDANPVTYEFHAGQQYDTSEGVETSNELTRAAQEFDIHRRFGVAPHSFFGYRVPSTSNDSLSYLFTGPDGVLQTTVKNPQRSNPMLGIVHSTSLRADLYAGNFTVNDQFITMPFNNSFQYVPDVPRVTAEKILGNLNGGSRAQNKEEPSQLRRHLETEEDVPRDESFHLGHDVDDYYLAWIRLQHEEHHYRQSILASRSGSETTSASYGYVTKDQCPGYGDDVIHTPLPVAHHTSYVATTIPDDSSDLIDVVFDSFIAKWVLPALNQARAMTVSSLPHRNKNYTMEDVKEYSPLKTNQVLGIYAESKWNN